MTDPASWAPLKSCLFDGTFYLLAACSTTPAMVDPSQVIHIIDRQAWTQMAAEDETLVIMNYEEGKPVCGRTPTARATAALLANEDAVFGTACGTRVVLLRRLSTPADPADWIFVAAHEAFHSAVQYSVLRPRFDSVAFPGYPPATELPRIRALAAAFTSAIDSANGARVCSAIEELMRSPIQIRDYFLYRSYWEWPAEHYMRHSAMRDLEQHRYLARRRAWSEGAGNPLYEVGVAALDMVEADIGRAEWQRRYLRGEAPMNMLAEASGCTPPLPRSFQVDAVPVDIFED